VLKEAHKCRGFARDGFILICGFILKYIEKNFNLTK
jgi:hypothetical protein